MLDTTPLGNFVGKVPDDRTVHTNAGDVNEGDVPRKGNVVLTLAHAKGVFNTPSKRNEDFFVGKIGHGEENVGGEHKPATAEVETPRPGNRFLGFDLRPGGAEGADSNFSKLGVFEDEAAGSGGTALATSFPKAGSTGGARAGTTSVFGAVGRTAFGLTGARTARRIGVVGARLGLKLFVSGTR
jgi:hypothetical protein